MISLPTRTDESTVRDNKPTIGEWFTILTILIIVAFIYCPVLTNAFNGDDFVHLSWLNQAIQQPSLIWRNFHSSWLDLTTAQFYRPLISIFMVADYLMWHNNGIGFHLTNLCCHLGNTFLLWLLLRALVSDDNQPISLNHHIWCAATAALFGLYPLHPEAVSWITGRVDTFVTLFSLSTILCYIYWRKSHNYKWLFLSIAAMICGLLSKEMAITIPFVLGMYELCFATPKLSLFRSMLSAGKQTSPFWLTWLFYFALRYYALGTLVGGYDNTLFAFENCRQWLKMWLYSTYVMVFPFNQTILREHDLTIILWAALIALSLVLSLKCLFLDKLKTKKDAANFVFMVSWLILSLIPVYRLFNISADLQGSRLAYLATAPLCALLCFGFANCTKENDRIHYWTLCALTAMLSIAGAGLLVNNYAWIKAQTASRNILRALDSLAKTKTTETITYIVGLPDQINGAYVCRNALDGMTKYPQISKDIHNCFNLSEINQIFPFGYARQSIIRPASSFQSPQFYLWNNTQQNLQPFHLQKLPDDQNKRKNFWSGIELKDIVIVPDQFKNLINFDQNGNMLVDASKAGKSSLYPYVALNLNGRPCFETDCLVIETDCPGDTAMSDIFSFLYKNRLSPDYDQAHQLNWTAPCSNQRQKIIFPLQGQINWAMGGTIQGIRLILPQHPCRIVSFSLEAINKYMPLLSFTPNANQNALGYIELDNSHPSCQLDYDAKEMTKAKTLMLEFSPANQTLAVLNDFRPPKSSLLLKELPTLTGNISLSKLDFPSPGIYELRLRAFDNNHQTIGVAGDHVVITVK